MANYHVGTSPITNTIYAGRIDKRGQTWASKSDVTGPACGAVAEHVIAHGGTLLVGSKGIPKFRIVVTDLTKPEGELDSLPQVIPATPQAFDDLAYQILALALNNGTREAFPGKLRKLLEEVANAQT